MSTILPSCIRKPVTPVSKTYRPAGAVPYRVKDGDSWVSLAREKGLSPWALIRYNYPDLPADNSQAAKEVNWYLANYVGCTKLTPDKKNYCFSSAANPGYIHSPGRVNSSIYHPVPIMKQPKTWSCWYTSLQMVVKYYRDRGMGQGLVDPSEDAETQDMYTKNKGISARERIARKLGFSVVYASLSDEGMWDMLRSGPVIYAGAWPGKLSGHWVVIVGISAETLAINNPASGMQSWDYDYFMGEYLLQTAERPLIYVE